MEITMPTHNTPHPLVVALLERAEHANLSPLALCKLAGLHHSVMNRWRRGKASPRLETLQGVYDTLTKYEAKLERERRRREAAATTEAA
jgi:transcriptional regulator with XRE-family HTH domain